MEKLSASIAGKKVRTKGRREEKKEREQAEAPTSGSGYTELERKEGEADGERGKASDRIKLIKTMKKAAQVTQDTVGWVGCKSDRDCVQ